MNRLSPAILICAATLFSTQLGCGPEDPRGKHVRGSVTFKGAPVPAGDIQFLPKPGNTGPAGSAKIIDGKFDTAAVGGKGTVGGPHQVIINGFDGQADPDAELPLGKPIFKDFKVDFDIPTEGEGTSKDFDVSAK